MPIVAFTSGTYQSTIAPPPPAIAGIAIAGLSIAGTGGIASKVTSASYTVAPLPYVFMVTAPLGPIPASLQPAEVWPVFDGSGNPYFSMEIDAGGPWGQWTTAQLQAASVAAVTNTGWLISTFTPLP